MFTHELQRRADGITARILYGSEPWVDVQIAIGALREWVDRQHPDRSTLFEMVYEARWRRLIEQDWAARRPAPLVHYGSWNRQIEPP